MYYLHFHEGKQAFKIIPEGVTITEAYDGVSVMSSTSWFALKAYAVSAIMASRKAGVLLSADVLERREDLAIFHEIWFSIKVKED